MLFVTWSGALTGVPSIDRFSHQVTGLGPGGGLLLAYTVLMLSVVSQPLQLRLVRLMEGYWEGTRLGRHLKAGRVPLYDRQWAEAYRVAADTSDDGPSDAERETAADRLRFQLPQPGRLLPTSLGNALRAAEDRAGQRYGLQTVEFWPRLYPLLSDRVSAIVDDARNQLDTAARLSAVFCLCDVFLLGGLAAGFLHDVARVLLVQPITPAWYLVLPAVPVLGLSGLVAIAAVQHLAAFLNFFLPYMPWLLLIAAVLALSGASYRSAVGAARTYGIAIETAFDLHRFDLLKALHLSLPPDHDAEVADNGTLTTFLLRSHSMPQYHWSLRYQHDETGSADDSGASGP